MYKLTIKLRIEAYVLRFCLFTAYWIVTLEKIHKENSYKKSLKYK